MAKRFIGIDIDREQVRVAILEAERGAPTLTAAAGRPYSGPEDLLSAVQELLGETPAFGDRLATALPASAAFARWLKFPFAETRKLAAALPLELGSQLPVPLDQFLTDFLSPRPAGDDGFSVPAVALRRSAVAELTAAFDEAGIPLHIVDVAPFALVPGLRDIAGDSILAHLGEAETSLTLVRDGQPLDLRLIPGGPPPLPVLLREGAALQRAARISGIPWILAGAGATAELQSALREAEEKVAVATITLDGQSLAPEFLPALALARRAAMDKERLFNFRRGPFALKSEWMVLKRRLVAAGVLLAVALGATGFAGWLDYSRRAHRAEALRQEMMGVFRTTFPGQPLVADVPLQMAAKIKEVEDRVRLIGSEGAQSALTVLQELSLRVPAEVKVDVREYSFGADGVRLEGNAPTFDAANQMAKALEASPLVLKAQVADAKMSLDGSQVDFRMILSLSDQKVRP